MTTNDIMALTLRELVHVDLDCHWLNNLKEC